MFVGILNLYWPFVRGEDQPPAFATKEELTIPCWEIWVRDVIRKKNVRKEKAESADVYLRPGKARDGGG